MASCLKVSSGMGCGYIWCCESKSLAAHQLLPQTPHSCNTNITILSFFLTRQAVVIHAIELRTFCHRFAIEVRRVESQVIVCTCKCQKGRKVSSSVRFVDIPLECCTHAPPSPLEPLPSSLLCSITYAKATRTARPREVNIG